MKKPIILVTNDDGITSPGIKALMQCAAEIGTPIVVAPDSPQSGQGHAITITKPIGLKAVDIFPGIIAYECSGTPADCVKLAKNVILKDKEIDLCISGINHGSNASINIIYSGTMSAAMEASIEGITSIGFSNVSYAYDADLSGCKRYALQLMKAALDKQLGDSKLLNVNFPDVPPSEIKGFKVCRQGKGNWKENFLENKDPRDQPYYWLTGEFLEEEHENDTDLWALSNGYISIVPSKHDLTDYTALKNIGHLEKIKDAT